MYSEGYSVGIKFDGSCDKVLTTARDSNSPESLMLETATSLNVHFYFFRRPFFGRPFLDVQFYRRADQYFWSRVIW